MDRLFEWLLVSSRFPIWARYLITTGLVACAFGIRSQLTQEVDQIRFLLLFPVIILAGTVFDRGSAIYATFLSAALVAYFLMPPTLTFGVASETDAMALGLFVLVGFLTSALIEALHTGFLRAHQQRDEISALAQERDALLRELSHRLQNDLTTILAALRLQARRGEPVARAALTAAGDRVEVLARVHRRLRPEDGSVVLDTGQFFLELCNDLQVALQRDAAVVLRAEVESHRLDTRHASAFGLMLHELLTNATKYAALEGGAQIDVTFRRLGEHYCLSVRDHGPGAEPGVIKGGGLGHRLIRSIAASIGGTVAMENAAPGLRVEVRAPVREDKPR
jgi:two-component sensor histidine kinase